MYEKKFAKKNSKSRKISRTQDILNKQKKFQIVKIRLKRWRMIKKITTKAANINKKC